MNTFHRVLPFCCSKTISTEYYHFYLQNVVFEEGESRKSIIITIKEDNNPEPDETFEVILINPSNGAILGDDMRGGCPDFHF